jgi:hypothetical protein
MKEERGKVDETESRATMEEKTGTKNIPSTPSFSI